MATGWWYFAHYDCIELSAPKWKCGGDRKKMEKKKEEKENYEKKNQGGLMFYIFLCFPRFFLFIFVRLCHRRLVCTPRKQESRVS